jgi:hypothetical protein
MTTTARCPFVTDQSSQRPTAPAPEVQSSHASKRGRPASSSPGASALHPSGGPSRAASRSGGWPLARTRSSSTSDAADPAEITKCARSTRETTDSSSAIHRRVSLQSDPLSNCGNPRHVEGGGVVERRLRDPADCHVDRAYGRPPRGVPGGSDRRTLTSLRRCRCADAAPEFPTASVHSAADPRPPQDDRPEAGSE